MSIPHRGARRIVVDGVTYRWLIRHRATYSQADYGSGRLHVAVEHAETPGQVLVLVTTHPHPDDWATAEAIALTPADVARGIRAALEAGWAPTQPGPQLVLRFDSLAARRS